MRAEILSALKPFDPARDRHGGRSELRVLFPSSPLAVRDALASTLSGMEHLRLTEDEASTVELVLAEVMNNIVEHAYADRPDGMVELRIAHGPEGLTCQVLDTGRPMPRGRPPLGLPPDPHQPADAQPEGGFGWFLIRELAEDLVYRHGEGGNSLSFRLPVARPLRSS